MVVGAGHINFIQMKRFALTLLAGFIMTGWLTGCKQNTPEKEETDIWDEAAVEHVLRKTMWRVEKVFRVTGSEVVDLENDPGFDNKYFDARKSLLFSFNDTGIDVLESQPMKGDPKFREGAETYEFTNRLTRPTNVSYEWDDTRQTVIAKSEGARGFLDVPAGFTGVLDKSSIVTYSTYQEEEQSEKPSGLVFEVEAGSSVYKYYLKPVWYYETAPVVTHIYRYVVFP